MHPCIFSLAYEIGLRHCFSVTEFFNVASIYLETLRQLWIVPWRMVSLKVYYSSGKGRESVLKFKQKYLTLNKLLTLFLVSAFSPLTSCLSECLRAVLIVLTRANEIPSVVTKLKYSPHLYLTVFRDLLIGSWWGALHRQCCTKVCPEVRKLFLPWSPSSSAKGTFMLLQWLSWPGTLLAGLS